MLPKTSTYKIEKGGVRTSPFNSQLIKKQNQLQTLYGKKGNKRTYSETYF